MMLKRQQGMWLLGWLRCNMGKVTFNKLNLFVWRPAEGCMCGLCWSCVQGLFHNACGRVAADQIMTHSCVCGGDSNSARWRTSRLSACCTGAAEQNSSSWCMQHLGWASASTTAGSSSALSL